jgi:hypothetical protein
VVQQPVEQAHGGGVLGHTLRRCDQFHTERIDLSVRSTCYARVSQRYRNATETTRFLPSGHPPPHLDGIAIVVELSAATLRCCTATLSNTSASRTRGLQGRPAIRSAERYHWPARGGIVRLRVLHAQDQASVPRISVPSPVTEQPRQSDMQVLLGNHALPSSRPTWSNGITPKVLTRPCGRRSATGW